MKRSIFEKYIRLSEWNQSEIEAAIIAAYLRINEIEYDTFGRIISIVKVSNDLLTNKMIQCFQSEYRVVDIYAVVDVFETIISESKKKENGVVYTPYGIQKIIIENLFSKKDEVPTVCDPSAGCGSFLLTAAKWIHRNYKLSYSDIFDNYIYGVELSRNAVEQAVLLFDLLAMENGEVPLTNYNIVCGDATDKKLLDQLKENFGAFDYVIGNPPYVRSRNIRDEGKKNLCYWNSASIGNVDLYIPFYEIGLYLLKSDGELGYISPNTFMQAVNGRGLRKELIKNNFLLRIADFRETQMFRGVTNYTCIVWIDKGSTSGGIFYSRIKDSDDLQTLSFKEYPASQFLPDKRWRMFGKTADIIINKFEHAGQSLNTWTIRNGLATLKNDLFFFMPEGEDKDYFYRTYNGKQYKIEKRICIDVAKPNIIKNEADLQAKMEKAIFPYYRENGVIKCLDEETMKRDFSNTYSFLSEYKQVLLKRDKGKGKYSEWYAYGRTQGMNNFGKKLLIPYISSAPIAVICTNPNVLFYCGYALLSDSEEELLILKRFLESEAFWYYICTTSKPYSKDYMAFAKSYITKFSIPLISKEEKKWLLTEESKSAINAWIWRKYGIEK